MSEIQIQTIKGIPINRVPTDLNGRIHRLDFLFVNIITNAAIQIITLLMENIENWSGGNKIELVVTGSLILIISLYVQICALIKRLRDVKWNVWLTIIAIIPIVGIFISLPLLFIKSKYDD